jgi:predicted dithiol-disulfide oxidoreductase (DUF899 family)
MSDNGNDSVEQHIVIPHEEWLGARTALLAAEKDFTRRRDDLSRLRRELPWEKVDTEYVFDAPSGEVTLPDLFGSRSQLIVYHFMFSPEWDEGCPSCSFWADNYDGIVPHLQNRDVSLVAISRAPLEKLEAYQRRMGWSFKWLSSLGNEFNRDFGASFTEEDLKQGGDNYNFATTRFSGGEAPGASVFTRGDDGGIYRTYSCYARGLDMLNGAYHHLDLVPKGRNEQGLPYSMAWVRRHDKYE